MVEILHYAADGIYQRRVVRIFIVYEDRTLADNLQRLADRILPVKESLSQSFSDDALIRRIEGCPPVSFYQFEIEEAEEGGVCQHDDTVLFISFLHLSLAILDSSVLAHHATALFYFWAHLFDLLCRLRPHKEVFVAARQIDAVGILMPRVDAILPPRVVAHEDDKHQRHHQTC